MSIPQAEFHTFHIREESHKMTLATSKLSSSIEIDMGSVSQLYIHIIDSE